MKTFRFKFKEGQEYVGSVVNAALLDEMEREKSFRIDNVNFTVPTGLETFTILIEADAVGFSPSPISGCPWHITTSSGNG